MLLTSYNLCICRKKKLVLFINVMMMGKCEAKLQLDIKIYYNTNIVIRFIIFTPLNKLFVQLNII